MQISLESLNRQQIFYYVIWFSWFIYILLNYLLVGRIVLKPIIDSLAITGLFIGVFKWNELQIPSVLKIWVIWGLVICVYLFIHGLATGHISGLLEHRYNHFRLFLLLPFLAVLVSVYKPRLEFVSKGFVLTGLFASYLTIQFFINGSPPRGAGVFGKPIIHGNLGMFSAVMCLVCFFVLHNWKWKVLAIISMLSGVCLSILSESRGGWLALLISLVTVFLFTRKSHPKSTKAIYFLSAIILLVTAFLWEYLPIQQRIEELFSNLEQYFAGSVTTSIGYRLQFWKVSFSSFLDSPVFGAGIDTFHETWSKAIINNEATGSSKFFHAHNDYLMMLSQLGIVGFLLIMGWILWPVYVFVSRKPNLDSSTTYYWGLLTVVSTETILEFMITNNAFFTRPLYEIFVICCVFALSSVNDRQCMKNRDIKRT